MKKRNNTWKEKWFGDWLDIDILANGNNAIEFKKEDGLREKRWEVEIKGERKKYIEYDKNDTTPTYE